MIQMISRFTSIIFIFGLVGCATSTSPWQSKTNAQKPPSVLTETTIGVEAEGTTYDPYDYYNKDIASLPEAYQSEVLDEEFLNAERDFEYTPSVQPSSIYNEELNTKIQRRTVKIAVLLPLSGPNKSVGKAMMNAAQQALFDLNVKGVELLPKDTAGTKDGAILAANNAINQNVDLVLGPLFADNAKATRSLFAQANINNISFTTDWTAAGSNTFVMGILPFAQVSRITEYTAQMGYRDYGLITPNTEYGRIVKSSFQRAVRQNRGRISKEYLLNPLSESISMDIRDFTNFDERKLKYEEELAEVEAILEVNKNNRDANKKLKELEALVTLGDLPFEVLMVPVGGEDARTLVNLLRFYDVDNRNSLIIGTGLWDDPSFISEDAFDGALFAAPSPQARGSFESNYAAIYGQRPPRIASLAYDATALVAVLADKAFREGYPNAPYIYMKNDLQNPNGFAGIDGIFRFGRNNLVERGLAVLEVQDGTLIVKDPAPITFQSAR